MSRKDLWVKTEKVQPLTHQANRLDKIKSIYSITTPLHLLVRVMHNKAPLISTLSSWQCPSMTVVMYHGKRNQSWSQMSMCELTDCLTHYKRPCMDGWTMGGWINGLIEAWTEDEINEQTKEMEIGRNKVKPGGRQPRADWWSPEKEKTKVNDWSPLTLKTSEKNPEPIHSQVKSSRRVRQEKALMRAL